MYLVVIYVYKNLIDYSTGSVQLSTTNLAIVTFSVLNYNFGIHLLHRKTRVVSEWDYALEHSSSSAEANVLLRSGNSRLWNMNITSTLPFYTIITPQPSSIPKLHVMLAHLTYPEVVACTHEQCKISISVVTSTAPTTFLTWSHPSHLSPIQGMISQPNLYVARIEYRILNAALKYKILPGGCRNRQVPQFNPPHRQQLPMRRELVWHQHLSPWIWKKW